MSWKQSSENDKSCLAGTATDKVLFSHDPKDQGTVLTPEKSAVALARLTDGLALIVCAARALRAVDGEINMPDVAAEVSALRQGIAAVQRAASNLGLALVVPPIAESGESVDCNSSNGR